MTTTQELLKRLEGGEEASRCKFPLCSSHARGECLLCPESKYDDPRVLAAPTSPEPPE